MIVCLSWPNNVITIQIFWLSMNCGSFNIRPPARPIPVFKFLRDNNNPRRIIPLVIDLAGSPYKDTGVLECPTVSARHITANRSKYYRESDRLRWLVCSLTCLLSYTPTKQRHINVGLLTGTDLHMKYVHRYVGFSSF